MTKGFINDSNRETHNFDWGGLLDSVTGGAIKNVQNGVADAAEAAKNANAAVTWLTDHWILLILIFVVVLIVSDIIAIKIT